jgi:excisionase family DNA binding protein
MSTSESDYCTVAEAAALLRVSKPTIWRWIDSGRLPAVRVGGRTIRIRRSDIDMLVEPARLVIRETEPSPYIARQAEKDQDPMRIVEELRDLRQRILAGRGGRLTSDSVQLIRAAREARSADFERRSRDARIES